MAAQDFSDIRGKKVMVIDDSNTIRRSAEIFLSQAGCQVILAQDGFEALSKINDHQPNIIFCDILMPRLDGYQTCALIKRSPRFRVPAASVSSPWAISSNPAPTASWTTTIESTVVKPAAAKRQARRFAALWRSAATKS